MCMCVWLRDDVDVALMRKTDGTGLGGTMMNTTIQGRSFRKMVFRSFGVFFGSLRMQEVDAAEEKESACAANGDCACG